MNNQFTKRPTWTQVEAKANADGSISGSYIKKGDLIKSGSTVAYVSAVKEAEIKHVILAGSGFGIMNKKFYKLHAHEANPYLGCERIKNPKEGDKRGYHAASKTLFSMLDSYLLGYAEEAGLKITAAKKSYEMSFSGTRLNLVQLPPIEAETNIDIEIGKIQGSPKEAALCFIAIPWHILEIEEKAK
jgi:hypothetical protein